MFSHSVMSDCLWPNGLQHSRLLSPSPSPRVCSNSCHWVDDVIQPSNPLSASSPPTFPSIRVFSSELAHNIEANNCLWTRELNNFFSHNKSPCKIFVSFLPLTMVFPIVVSTIRTKFRFKIHDFLSSYCKVCFIKMNVFVNLCSSQNVNQGYLLQLWPIVENILWQRVIHSCLENLMDRKAWWAIVHGVTHSQTQLRD